MEERLTPQDAHAHVRGVCFKTGPPRRVGIELEWLVHDLADPLNPVSAPRLEQALAPLAEPGSFPGGSALSREPGGQVELSSPPAALADALRVASADCEALRRGLAARGLVLAGWGLEPVLEPGRVLDHPRYRAMEAHFDRRGPWGRLMMRASAGLQVNLDAGDETRTITGWRRRWQLAHRIGPVLVAAFANSPLWRGRPTGWRSSRQALWARLDPCRTRAPDAYSDPRDAWADYALDASVLCIQRPEPESWHSPAGLTMRSWISGAGDLRPPGMADLDYHLTTLFPPVRPRGWLELRMIDAQHRRDWTVPVAVATALMDDPVAADAAWDATEPLCPQGAMPAQPLWENAARDGLSSPEIGKAALGCFAAAERALSGEPALQRSVGDFIERYVARGRCPADDHLDALLCGALPEPLKEAWR